MEFIAGLGIGILGIVISLILHSSSSNQLKQLTIEKSNLEQLNNELVRAKNLLQEKLPMLQIHTILLDGMSGAGKTTFAARLANPTLTQADLKTRISATEREYLTTELPLCWEKQSGRTVINTLRFYDVAGEKASTVVNALISLSEEKKVKHQNVVLVVIWDISKTKEENEKYLSGYRLEATYGNVMAKRLIKSIVVFFNKTDSLSPEQQIKRVHDYSAEIERVFTQHFEVGYGNITFCNGSALSGAGLFDCYGAVLRKLDLAGNFSEILQTEAA